MSFSVVMFYHDAEIIELHEILLKGEMTDRILRKSRSKTRMDLRNLPKGYGILPF